MKIKLLQIIHSYAYIVKQVIWMFGSSIITRAFVESSLRPGGTDLNLDRLNITLWWQGSGGLDKGNAIQKLQVLTQVGPLPSPIFINCGGNDLGKISVKKIMLAIIKLLQYLSWEFPYVHIILSLILPRLRWCYSEKIMAMERARKRINSFITNKVCEIGGSVVQCPDISDHSQFFQRDGVHLSDLGNQIFLNTIQGRNYVSRWIDLPAATIALIQPWQDTAQGMLL